MHISQRFIICLCGFVLTGCSGPLFKDKIDPAGNLSRADYLALRHRGDNLGEPEDKDKAPEKTPPIPDMPQMLPPPVTQEKLVAEDKRISLTVTDDVPLRDLLLQLAQGAGVNMEIDSRIEGHLIFTATNQPFREVLARLCDMAGLRIRKDGPYLRVEEDEPYSKTYKLDYPSLTRRTNSEISIATNVFDVDVAGTNGSSSKSSGTASDNNSTAKIAGSSDADFWAEIDKSLTKLIQANKAPQLRGKSTRAKDDAPQAGMIAIDRQAGLVTIVASERQHKKIEKYLDDLRQKATTQVLIEARIVEVELTDGFQSGVNWQSVLSKASAAYTLGVAAGGSAASASDGLFTASVAGSDFSGILNLVRTFGATRVLSSPRLTVLNNQTAVLKVARNEVYFITNAQYSTTVNASGVAVSGSPVFTSTPHTVPVGLIMTVQPAIDSDRGLVTMTLRPTISRVVDRVADPSISLNAAQAGLSTSVTSKVPVLAVREMDSVVQLHSGEVAVMGGLMQDSSTNQDNGVPPFDSVPVLGMLAKSRDNSATTSELVILLRATIMPGPRPDPADIDLYNKYNQDPRPLSFSY